jgi:hypothetical protein
LGRLRSCAAAREDPQVYRSARSVPVDASHFPPGTVDASLEGHWAAAAAQWRRDVRGPLPGVFAGWRTRDIRGRGEGYSRVAAATAARGFKSQAGGGYAPSIAVGLGRRKIIFCRFQDRQVVGANLRLALGVPATRARTAHRFGRSYASGTGTSKRGQ